LKAVIEALNICGSSRQVQLHGCWCLKYMGIYYTGPAVTPAGYVKEVLWAMDNFIRDMAAQEAGCCALRTLALASDVSYHMNGTPENQLPGGRLVLPGAGERVLRAMSNFDGQSFILKAACDALEILAKLGEEARRELGEAGLCERLFDALYESKSQGDSSLQKSFITAMGMVAVRPTNARRLGRGMVYKLLADVLESHGDFFRWGDVSSAVSLMSTLAKASRHCARGLASNGARRVVDSLLRGLPPLVIDHEGDVLTELSEILGSDDDDDDDDRSSNGMDEETVEEGEGSGEGSEREWIP